MTNNRRAGKQYERVMAKRMGAKRIGVLGKEDLEHPIWSIEAKKRRAFAGAVFMDQAVRNCPEGKTPVVMVHVTGQRHGNDLVMMRLADWEQWFGTLAACKIADEVL